jgi:hypothetical protein
MRRWGSKPTAAGASWREKEGVVGETGGGRSGREGRRGHVTSTGAPVQSAAGMGDSGGSVMSVDVERISFGGKVRASLLPPIFSLLQLISALREGEDGWGLGGRGLRGLDWMAG